MKRIFAKNMQKFVENVSIAHFFDRNAFLTVLYQIFFMNHPTQDYYIADKQLKQIFFILFIGFNSN